MELEILLSTWGNVILGILLILFNLPVFIATLIDKQMRRQYALLSAVLLGSTITGFNCMTKGINRFLISSSNETVPMVTLGECYKNVSFVKIYESVFLGAGLGTKMHVTVVFLLHISSENTYMNIRYIKKVNRGSPR